MTREEELYHMRLLLAHVRGYEGVEPEDVEVHGLVPGDEVQPYSKLLGAAIGRMWRECGQQLPPGSGLPDVDK